MGLAYGKKLSLIASWKGLFSRIKYCHHGEAGVAVLLAGTETYPDVHALQDTIGCRFLHLNWQFLRRGCGEHHHVICARIAFYNDFGKWICVTGGFAQMRAQLHLK